MQEYKIELCVRLKGADLVALTARNTLRQDLGYEDILEGLEREDHWSIRVQAEDGEESKRLAERLASKTKLFVNPNKHTYRIGRREKREERRKEGIYEIWVLVNFIEDKEGELTCETLRSTYGLGNIIGVRRGTLWKMDIRAQNEEEARGLAEEMTFVRSVNKGLLVNPHSQSYTLL